MSTTITRTGTPAVSFEFPTTGHQLRVFEINGEHHFHATDVATMLGYREAKDLTRGLTEDERGRHIVPTLGGQQTVNIITEPGLYHALGNRRPGAIKDPEIRAQVEAFQRWVNHEVLPAIRQTGRYTAPIAAPAPALTDSELIAKALVAATNILTETTAKLEATTEQLSIAAPKAERYDQWLNTDDEINLDDAAKYLSGNPVLLAAGVRTGPHLLRETLQDWKWIHRPGGRVKGNTNHLRPVQRKSNEGMIYLRPGKDFWHQGQRRWVKGDPVLVVSRKGLDKIYDRFLTEAPRPMFDTDDLLTN